MFDGSFTANEVEELKKDFERKLAKLEHVFGLRLSNLKQEIINELSPQQNGAGLPPIDEITKIEAQMFTNTAKGKPGCQLKLYIWTCPTKLMANHRCGNMNEKYIPLHRVNDRRGHDKLRGIWRQVADFGVDLLERAGKMKGADHPQESAPNPARKPCSRLRIAKT